MCSKVLLLLVLVVRTYGHQNKMCDSDTRMGVTKGTHLPNGDVHLNGMKKEQNEYFMDTEAGDKGVCICEKQICVRKCCPFGTAYDSVNKICVDSVEAFDPPVWNDRKVLKGVNASEKFHFVMGKMNCTLPAYRLRIGQFGQVSKVFRLREDGQLYVEFTDAYPPTSLFPPDKYCIDTFVTGEGADRKTSLEALVCMVSDSNDDMNYTVLIICMLISCLFILATVVIYAWLPELRNLHGKVLMAYLVCLFVGFLLMSTMQILLELDNISEETCHVLTFFIYFFLLSAFFWLNVMCFDIWWTFSGNRGKYEHMSVNARLGAYAVYAFSIPTLLTCLLIALEYSDLPQDPLLPNLGPGTCFITGTSKLIYFYGPILVLCVANMVFFILTAIKINNIKKQTAMLKSKESSMHDQHRHDKQRLTLYIKLFVVMGINWILEVISAIYPEGDNIWRYTDAYNVLVGFFIFILFVCKRKIFRLIKKRVAKIYRGDDECQNDMDNSRRFSHMSQWRNQQRSSIDTIRTTLGSNNTIKTTEC